MSAALRSSPRPIGPIPDLLSAEARVRVELGALRQALVFGFAIGTSVEAFDEVLARAALPPSSWDRAQFARDLFLEQLVEGCLQVRVGGRVQAPSAPYLLRAIAEPPCDPETLEFRRQVLGELAESEALRADFERVYGELVQLRGLFCGRQTVRGLRRIDILRAVHATFGDLARSFGDASSGLTRLRDFGRAVLETAGYRRLDALLDHEAHLGTVDVRVRVGSDGEVRTFQIVSVRENRDNPFHASPLGRWIAKLMLFLRGYRMNGGEVVERLYNDVFSGLEESVALAFQLLADMEFYLAGLGFRDLARQKGLAVCFPEIVPHGGAEEVGMDLTALFNPLLLAERSPPVPTDLATARQGTVVVVTGPNSGGKTRLLQAIALAQMLGEAGLFVPAAKARLPRASGLFVSLLDEARADQPEGHLGMELIRIRRMFEELELGSLVLLDELCSGTNPSEGEEIARLVISLLPELEAQVFVSTHLLQFAGRLAEERPIPSLEFIQVEIGELERPTYRFIPGVARTSLAHKTAARLGVTRDELLALIAEKKRAPGVEPPTSSPPPSSDAPRERPPSEPAPGEVAVGRGGSL